MQATPVGETTVDIDWTWDSADMNGEFELLRRVGDDEFSLGNWPIGTNSALSTQDFNAPVGHIRYELYHTDVNGNRARVATDEVWNSLTGETEPKLWPNPSDGEVHLQLVDAENCQVQLIGIYGDLIAEWKGAAAEVQNRFEESVPNLVSGVYLVKCITAGKPFILRMVRQ